jgi:hypothetical protein
MKQEIPEDICKFGASAEQLQEYVFLTDNQRLVLIARKKVHLALEKIKNICEDDLAIKRYYKSITRYYDNHYQDYEKYLFFSRLLLALSYEIFVKIDKRTEYNI